jgi:GTPase SAR1 family protein
MKILLSGPSGVGKTTMANDISKEWDIPFIQGSSKNLWDKYRIKSHQHLIELCNNDLRFAVDFQYELLEVRKKIMKMNESFVTDRSPLDSMVYFLLNVSDRVDSNETLNYIKECSKSFPDKYIQIFLGLTSGMLIQKGIEDDGFRINNIYYQLMVNNIFKGVIEGNWLDMNMNRFEIIETWDREIRDKKTYKLIKHYNDKGYYSGSLFRSAPGKV